MTLILGDCLEKLKEIPADSIDSLVTDPPAGISFMGKDWDHHKGGRKEWCAWMEGVMRECYRVMKPGAHGLVWALPRTSHWTATALEDAGFEIRDCIYHLFGSGFPKSLDVSKAIDKAAGAQGEAFIDKEFVRRNPGKKRDGIDRKKEYSGTEFKEGEVGGTRFKPATDAAKQWSGFGTALKPAVECWWLVRKPCSEKTVAANVLKWGTGALNIDGCRIDHGGRISSAKIERSPKTKDILGKFKSQMGQVTRSPDPDRGRFPSHLLLSHSPFCTHEEVTDRNETGKGIQTTRETWHCVDACAVRMLDEQSGISKSTGGRTVKRSGSTGLAAKSEGFEFIGIEREPEYFQIASQRIKGVACQLAL